MHIYIYKPGTAGRVGKSGGLLLAVWPWATWSTVRLTIQPTDVKPNVRTDMSGKPSNAGTILISCQCY